MTLGAKWVASATDIDAVEIEYTDRAKDVDAFYIQCLLRLPEMRLKHPHSPPIGFYIIADNGDVLRKFMSHAY